jgi:hypothetical protein
VTRAGIFTIEDAAALVVDAHRTSIRLAAACLLLKTSLTLFAADKI